MKVILLLYKRLNPGELIIEWMAKAIKRPCEALASTWTTFGLVCCCWLMNEWTAVVGGAFLPSKIVLTTNMNIDCSNLVKSLIRG